MKMRHYSKTEIGEIANRNAIPLDENWSGPGPVWPLIEKFHEAGSFVVIKLDGNRRDPGDNGQYTVVATGGKLGEAVIRGDFETLDESLCYLIGNYDRITSQAR